MTDDLVVFLRAQLDVDEQAARAATPGPWAALDGGVMSMDDETWPVVSTETGQERADRVHIARHDPARVLADVEAKRRIIAEYEAVDEYSSDPVESGWAQGLGVALRLLALPFADREGYDESWRP